MDSQSQSVVGLAEIVNDTCELQPQVLVPRTDAESPEASKDKVSPKQPFIIGNCQLLLFVLFSH